MILVVDDNPVNINILMEILSKIDDVVVALDGEEALEAMEEEKPDLVLLDIVMPGMDGYEVCRRIKANPSFKEVPVIFLSGNDSTEEKQKGMELGAVDFMTKPIDSDMVVKKVKDILG